MHRAQKLQKSETLEVFISDKRLQLINIFKKVDTILGHKINKIVNVTFQWSARICNFIFRILEHTAYW